MCYHGKISHHMYKYYNMSQLTLPIENDIAQIGNMMNLYILIIRNLNLIDTLIARTCCNIYTYDDLFSRDST